MAAGRKVTEQNKLQRLGELSDFDALVYVLQQAEPDCDARHLAKVLLDKYDRLCDVMETLPELLMRTPGVPSHMAEMITAYPALFRQYQESKNRTRQRVWDTATAYQLVRSKFLSRKTEIMVLQVLDSKGVLRYMGIVAEGNTRSVPLYIREIMRLCLAYEADTVYISHNHPSGNVTPSMADISVTKEIALALSGIDVSLSDHFIFTDEDFLSMRESGVLKKLRNEVTEVKRQILSVKG